MSATLHALPSCPTERIFDLRRAARDTGAEFSRIKPRDPSQPLNIVFTTGSVSYLPAGLENRRYAVVDPIDPNDGGHAA